MPAEWTPSVSTMPGLTELTRILVAPVRSRAIASRHPPPLGAAIDRGVGQPRGRGHRADVNDAPAGRAELLDRFLGGETSPSTLRLNCLWKCSAVTASIGANS